MVAQSAKQPELTGIVGYLPDNTATALKGLAGKKGATDIRFEPGSDKIMMRVKNDDIINVVAGSSSGGETRIHVLLRPGSLVETVVKMFRDVKSIEDPTLSRLSAVSSVSVSFV